MTGIFYHGSKQSGIKVFKPTIHVVGNGRPIVFATDNKLYALSMIYGTGADIAVSYSLNPVTGKKEMYCDELSSDALKLFEQEGYLYEVNSKSFIPSPEGLESEFISYEEVPVLKEIRIANLAEELKKSDVHFIPYMDVPESMSKRGKKLGESAGREHAPDRFK